MVVYPPFAAYVKVDAKPAWYNTETGFAQPMGWRRQDL